MVKIKWKLQLRNMRIHYHCSDHVLFSNIATLHDLVNNIDRYDYDSQEYHRQVIRARERLFARYGNLRFES